MRTVLVPEVGDAVIEARADGVDTDCGEGNSNEGQLDHHLVSEGKSGRHRHAFKDCGAHLRRSVSDWGVQGVLGVLKERADVEALYTRNWVSPKSGEI